MPKVTTLSDDEAAARAQPDQPWSRRLPGLTALVAAVLISVSAGAIAYLVVAQRTPTYLAVTGTLLDQPKAIARSQDAGVIDKLSRLRFKYAGILRSDSVVDPVAARLHLSRGAVAASIVSKGDTGSLLLFVGAQAASSDGAVQLSNQLSQQLAAFIVKEQHDNAIAPIDQVSLEIVAPARGATMVAPTTRQRYLTTVGAALATLVVALGVADLLRRRRV